jgi:hypothetical protein
VKGVRIRPGALPETPIEGLVLARDLRDAGGRVAFAKGHVLAASDRDRLTSLTWDEVHAIQPDAGEIHERAAGERLARAVAGHAVEVGREGGGHWPLQSTQPGRVRIEVPVLQSINALEGLCVYTVFDGQVVDAQESIARAKIIPFVIPDSTLQAAAALARSSGGVIRVTPFRPLRVGAVVQESLGDRGMDRFSRAISEKVGWFGGTLVQPRFVESDLDALRGAIDAIIAGGADIIAVAGSRAMDPLDPIFGALDAMGAVMIRRGVPAHPGSLCWIARAGPVVLVGMPSCGLFSQATVFDLILTRLFAGDPVDADALSDLGHGGFLTRDMAFRFPPYRRARERGEVE